MKLLHRNHSPIIISILYSVRKSSFFYAGIQIGAENYSRKIAQKRNWALREGLSELLRKLSEEMISFIAEAHAPLGGYVSAGP